MECKNTIETLQVDPKFVQWKSENQDSFLAHLFKMDDEANKDSWQIGYYDKEQNKITTFILENGQLDIVPKDDVFKKESDTIKKLDLEKVKIDLPDALATAKKLQEEKYSAEVPMNIIAILQSLDIGQVWNITYVTRSFKTLNIKIDAAENKVLKHEVVNFMDVQK